MMKARLLASDAESFAYCPVAWKIGQEMRPAVAARRRGLESHAELREALQRGRDLERSVILRLLYAVGAGLFMVLADEIAELLPSQGALWARGVFYVLAAMTAFLLWRFVMRTRELSAHQRELGHAVGDAESMDLPWSSPEHGLIGKPDVVLRTPEGRVPLEYKSSYAPHQPWESHLVQLGCYALLLESASGAPPRRGIIQYRDRQFEISLEDGRVRALAVDTLARMRRALDGEPVNRVHTNPGKCSGCVVRERCNQRLA